MNSIVKKQKSISEKILAVAVIVFIGVITLGVTAFGWTAPLSGPTGNNAGIKHFITTGDIAQVKTGRLGIVTTPPNQFDFRVDGHASFLSGIWASGAQFRDNVIVGFSSAADRNVKVYSNDFQVKGSNANIQNDKLMHGNTSTPQPVCSTVTGVLRLCSCDATAAAGSYGSANCPSASGNSVGAGGTGGTGVGGGIVIPGGVISGGGTPAGTVGGTVNPPSVGGGIVIPGGVISGSGTPSGTVGGTVNPPSIGGGNTGGAAVGGGLING
jgi:hypothetical protein